MIDVFGWYNKQNIGDDAFKDAFIKIAQLAGIDENFKFYTDELPPQDTPVVLGGGDVIRPFYLNNLSSDQAIFPFGVGLGYESESLLLAGRNIPLAVVRNKVDVALFERQSIETFYCPDITFCLDQSNHIEIRGTHKRKKVAVLLSDEVSPTFENRSSSEYMYFEYFKWELAESLDYMSQFYDIHFMAFSTLNSIDDRKIALDVFRRMEKRDFVTLNKEFENVNSARNAIAECDLVVSMKYHGILFALQHNVPFINIATTRKTQSFCYESELQDLSVVPFSFEKNRFYDILKIAETESAYKRIVAKSEELRSLARQVLPLALSRVLEAKERVR